ncbi:MAG: hypothetical protein RLZZ385_1250 [Pseudomonadota bacterium]
MTHLKSMILLMTVPMVTALACWGIWMLMVG